MSNRYEVLSLLLLIFISISGTGFAAQDEHADSHHALPEWVNRGSYSDGTTNYLVVQTSQPFTTPIEADRAIDQAVRDAIEKHLRESLGDGSPIFVDLPDSFIPEKLLVPNTRIVRQYEETFSEELAERYDQTSGTFYRGYAQIRLDDDFREAVRLQSRKQTTQHRLLVTGLMGSGLLGVLLVLFGYLRIDHATRGFYSGRLQSLGIIVVITLLIAIYYLYVTFL